MANKYNVRFSYYFPTIEFEKDANNGSPSSYWDMKKFLEWILNVKSNTPRPNATVAIGNSEFGALEWRDCKFDDKNNLYAFRLEKLRSKNLPATKTIGKDSQPINLKNNQYLGEFNLLVFDPQEQIVTVQKNHSGLSIGQIETALTELRMKWLDFKKINYDPKDPGIVHFMEIPNPNEVKDIENSKIFRKINLKCSDIKTLGMVNLNSHTINQAVVMGNSISGISVGITITMKRTKKEESLDVDEVKKLINDTINNKNELKLSVSGRKSSEDPLRDVDILMPKLTSDMSVNDNARTTIGFDFIYTNFIEQVYIDGLNMRLKVGAIKPTINN